MSYDPAIAANVISSIALAVSGFTLYRMWKKDQLEGVADYPDVLSQIWPVSRQAGWSHVQMKITNNFETDLELVAVRLDRPEGCKGISRQATMEPMSPSYVPKQLAAYPIDRAERVLEFRCIFSSAGTPAPRLPMHYGSIGWIDFFVYSNGPTPPKELRFSAIFSLRQDIGSAKRIVVRQKARCAPNRLTERSENIGVSL